MVATKRVLQRCIKALSTAARLFTMRERSVLIGRGKRYDLFFFFAIFSRECSWMLFASACSASSARRHTARPRARRLARQEKAETNPLEKETKQRLADAQRTCPLALSARASCYAGSPECPRTHWRTHTHAQLFGRRCVLAELSPS